MAAHLFTPLLRAQVWGQLETEKVRVCVWWDRGQTFPLPGPQSKSGSSSSPSFNPKSILNRGMIIQHLTSCAACELLESKDPGLCANTAPENGTQMLKFPGKFQKQIQECVCVWVGEP